MEGAYQLFPEKSFNLDKKAVSFGPDVDQAGKYIVTTDRITELVDLNSQDWQIIQQPVSIEIGTSKTIHKIQPAI